MVKTIVKIQNVFEGLKEHKKNMREQLTDNKQPENYSDMLLSQNKQIGKIQGL